MRILGIDPGSSVTGWGVVDSDGWALRLVGHGAVRCGRDRALPDRLSRLADGLDDVLSEHAPEAIAIEQVFAARNARAALVLGHARGVALLAAARLGVEIHEYSASQVKSSVTGNGRAEKLQVQRAVATQLGMRDLPRPQDASDALALAICHSAAARLDRRVRGLR